MNVTLGKAQGPVYDRTHRINLDGIEIGSICAYTERLGASRRETITGYEVEFALYSPWTSSWRARGDEIKRETFLREGSESLAKLRNRIVAWVKATLKSLRTRAAVDAATTYHIGRYVAHGGYNGVCEQALIDHLVKHGINAIDAEKLVDQVRGWGEIVFSEYRGRFYGPYYYQSLAS